MSLAIDANVLVAAAREEEEHWDVSIEFLKQVRTCGQAICCPTLVLPECSAAIARRTGNADLAIEILRRVEALPNLRLVPVTPDQWLQTNSGPLAAGPT